VNNEEQNQPAEPEESPAETGDIEPGSAAAEAADANDENLVSDSPSDDTPDLDPVSDDTPDLDPASDNRAEVRVNLDRPMLLRLSSGETVKVRMINLSPGGLAFEYPAPAEPGATFSLLFQLLNGSEVINIQAEGIAEHSHVKSTSFVTGIQFTKISAEDVNIIEEFVEYKLSSTTQLTGFAVSHRHRG